MIKRFILLAAVVLVVGCASVDTIPKDGFSKLEPGITKAEFIEKYGEPLAINYHQDHWILKYLVGSIGFFTGADPYYFVFDQHEILLGWQEIPRQQQQKSTMSGVILTFPIQ
ncbi:MAG: hypothetical protein HQ552_13770 [Desulfobacteraceae bacterium]|nr:hypothetical protein [Desulfobacteraceae bacterium]